MAEAFAVEVAIAVKGNVATQLDNIIANMERLDRVANDARETVTGLGDSIRALGRAGASVDKLISAMEKLRSAPGVNNAVDGIEKMAGATQSMLRATEDLSRVMRDNARFAAETAGSLGTAARATERAASRASGGRSGGAARGGAAAHGGGFGGHDFLLTGLAASAVGEPMVKVGENAMDRAIQVGHLKSVMQLDQRVTPAMADDAVSKAYAATNAAPGTRVSENMSALLDLKQLTGSLSEAETMLPGFAQMSSMLQVLDRKHGGGGEPVYAAMKALDIMGDMISEHEDASGHTVRELDPSLLQHRLELMSRAAAATNMRADPNQYLGFAKQARVAGMRLTDEFRFEKMPAMMSVIGGSRLGTAMMSMAQVFEGGKLTDKSYDAMAKVGLAEKSTIVSERNPKTGRMHKVERRGKIYDLDIMGTDPQKYVEAAQKHMEAAGVHGTDAQIVALMTASQRSTIAGALADILKDMPAILREQTNIQNTPMNASAQLAAQDPAAKLQQFNAAWDKFLTGFGSSALDDAMKVLGGVTDVLNRLGDWAKRNPDIARPITDVVAGLGAIAVALGTLSTAIFLFGPALKLLGIGGGAGGAAAASGVAGAAEAAAGVAMGPAAAIISGVAGVAVLGSHYETPETQKALDDLAKARRGDVMRGAPVDGFDVTGKPIAPHALDRPRVNIVPPAGSTATGSPGTADSTIRLGMDEKALGDGIGGHVANALNGAKVMMDGRIVGQLMIDQMGRILGNPASTGVTGFNPRMTPSPTGPSVRM